MFGKSLFLSTLASLFRGEKDLFKDLKISQTRYDFKKYEVINLDFKKLVASNFAQFEKSVIEFLLEAGRAAGVMFNSSNYFEKSTPNSVRRDPLSIEVSPHYILNELIQFLYEKSGKVGVVILVDEYDFPVTSNLGDSVLLGKILDFISSFFGIIKANISFIHCCFVTGLSDYAKVGSSCADNDLLNISMDHKFATSFGFTWEEVYQYFYYLLGDNTEDTTEDRVLKVNQLIEWYNGYIFSSEGYSVLNPISVLRCLTNCFKYDRYWVNSAFLLFFRKFYQNRSFIFLI